MRGRPTLWLPGTDHAGIATQVIRPNPEMFAWLRSMHTARWVRCCGHVKRAHAALSETVIAEEQGAEDVVLTIQAVTDRKHALLHVGGMAEKGSGHIR